ncbi:SDR family oxidoreductase [Sideroxyarcus emersonii]|nr:SDR family oxidoreductase [Sideroxyarcus emersonii]
MKRLLIIGCGDIARRVIPLLAGRYRTCALIRTGARGKELRTQGIMPILGDLDERASLARLAGLADIVLHLAPPPNAGTFDTRTRHLLAALSGGRPPERFVYISTSGVYGDCGGAAVGETRAIHPQNARAQRRADAERQIRRWARRNGVEASILRVPGIYAAERLPLERLRAGTPAFVAAEDGYTNHIHADDLARIVVAALRRGRANRVYHASDDSELKMGDYFDAVADAHGLPRPSRISRAEAQRVLPESLLSFMNESRRLTNERMKRELKVVLRYPTVAVALQSFAAGSAAK